MLVFFIYIGAWRVQKGLPGDGFVHVMVKLCRHGKEEMVSGDKTRMAKERSFWGTWGLLCPCPEAGYGEG